MVVTSFFTGLAAFGAVATIGTAASDLESVPIPLAITLAGGIPAYAIRNTPSFPASKYSYEFYLSDPSFTPMDHVSSEIALHNNHTPNLTDHDNGIKWLQIQHKTKNKSRNIQEGKRVMVKTADRKKYHGALKVINKDTIQIKMQRISLNDIERVKKPRLVTGLIGKTFRYFGGALVLGAPVSAEIVTSDPDDGFSQNGRRREYNNILFTQSAIGSGFVALSVPVYNIGARHKSKKWNYRIIQLETNSYSK